MGFVLHESKNLETESLERNLFATGKFTQFTYWNYDKVPSKNDAVVAALEWIDIAEAVGVDIRVSILDPRFNQIRLFVVFFSLFSFTLPKKPPAIDNETNETQRQSIIIIKNIFLYLHTQLSQYI